MMQRRARQRHEAAAIAQLGSAVLRGDGGAERLLARLGATIRCEDESPDFTVRAVDLGAGALDCLTPDTVPDAEDWVDDGLLKHALCTRIAMSQHQTLREHGLLADAGTDGSRVCANPLCPRRGKVYDKALPQCSRCKAVHFCNGTCVAVAWKGFHVVDEATGKERFVRGHKASCDTLRTLNALLCKTYMVQMLAVESALRKHESVPMPDTPLHRLAFLDMYRARLLGASSCNVVASEGILGPQLVAVSHLQKGTQLFEVVTPAWVSHAEAGTLTELFLAYRGTDDSVVGSLQSLAQRCLLDTPAAVVARVRNNTDAALLQYDEHPDRDAPITNSSLDNSLHFSAARAPDAIAADLMADAAMFRMTPAEISGMYFSRLQGRDSKDRVTTDRGAHDLHIALQAIIRTAGADGAHDILRHAVVMQLVGFVNHGGGGAALHPLPAMIKHSCMPNVALVANYDPALGSGGAVVIRAVALRNILPHESLTAERLPLNAPDCFCNVCLPKQATGHGLRTVHREDMRRVLTRLHSHVVRNSFPGGAEACARDLQRDVQPACVAGGARGLFDKYIAPRIAERSGGEPDCSEPDCGGDEPDCGGDEPDCGGDEPDCGGDEPDCGGDEPDCGGAKSVDTARDVVVEIAERTAPLLVGRARESAARILRRGMRVEGSHIPTAPLPVEMEVPLAAGGVDIVRLDTALPMPSKREMSADVCFNGSQHTNMLKFLVHLASLDEEVNDKARELAASTRHKGGTVPLSAAGGAGGV